MTLCVSVLTAAIVTGCGSSPSAHRYGSIKELPAAVAKATAPKKSVRMVFEQDGQPTGGGGCRLTPSGATVDVTVPSADQVGALPEGS